MMSKEKPMRYRGFEIISTADYDIHRMNRETGNVEVCKGYYCEVYDANDVGLINMFDSFCLAEGYEIKDCSYSSLLVGIAKYVDGCFDSYKESKWDMQDNRTYEILGRALCWLGESESGQELYNTFSEVLGMDDDEIRKMGFTSLVNTKDGIYLSGAVFRQRKIRGPPLFVLLSR